MRRWFFNNSALHSLHPPARDFLTAASLTQFSFGGLWEKCFVPGITFFRYVDSSMLKASVPNIAMETGSLGLCGALRVCLCMYDATV